MHVNLSVPGTASRLLSSSGPNTQKRGGAVGLQEGTKRGRLICARATFVSARGDIRLQRVKREGSS